MRTKLFCFPHAGGSTMTFKAWEPLMPPGIELCPVELAGRGRRISEPMYHSITEAVGDVYRLLKVQMQSAPYAVYGHSMGALIAFELAKRARKEKLPAPQHMFFAGKEAPHVKLPEEKMFHRFPEDKFKEKLIQLGGESKELFDNPDLLKLLMPMLKNDFFITETYDHNQAVEPFDGDITLFIGREDDIVDEEISGWLDQTRGMCSIHYLHGDHFFVQTHLKKVVGVITSQLLAGKKQTPAPTMRFFP